MDLLTAFTHEEVECPTLKCPCWIVREKTTSLCNVVAKLSPGLPFICANCMLKGKGDPCVHCLYIREHYHFIVDPLEFPEDVKVVGAILDACVTLQTMLEEIDTRTLALIRDKLYDDKPQTWPSNVREDEFEFLETTDHKMLSNVEAELVNRSISRFAFRQFRRLRKGWEGMVTSLSEWAIVYNRKNKEIVRECQKVSEGEQYEEKPIEESKPEERPETVEEFYEEELVEPRESDLETLPPTWENNGTEIDWDTKTVTEDSQPVTAEDTIV
jgi:hypothetical protein